MAKALVVLNSRRSRKTTTSVSTHHTSATPARNTTATARGFKTAISEKPLDCTSFRPSTLPKSVGRRPQATPWSLNFETVASDSAMTNNGGAPLLATEKARFRASSAWGRLAIVITIDPRSAVARNASRRASSSEANWSTRLAAVALGPSPPISRSHVSRSTRNQDSTNGPTPSGAAPLHSVGGSGPVLSTVRARHTPGKNPPNRKVVTGAWAATQCVWLSKLTRLLVSCAHRRRLLVMPETA